MPRSGRDGGRTSVDDGSGQNVTYYDGSGTPNLDDYAVIKLIRPVTLGDGVSTDMVTVWGKGVLSFGEPTAAQQQFMLAYQGGDMSGFPGQVDYVAPGASAQSYDTIGDFGRQAPINDDGTSGTSYETIVWIDADGRRASVEFPLDGGVAVSHSGDPDQREQIRAGGQSILGQTGLFYDVSNYVPAGLHVIRGGAGNDTLTANRDETLVGRAGDDTLIGSDSVVVMVGGAGADTLDVGSGAARIVYQATTDSTAAAPDVIHGLKATDVIDATALEATGIKISPVGAQYRVDMIAANGTLSFLSDQPVETSQIFYTAVQQGTPGDDTLAGSVVIGGAGSDKLSDGGGPAVFRYLALSDSSPVAGSRDQIDFVADRDQIDVRALAATGFSLSPGTVTIKTAAGDLVIGTAGRVQPNDILMNGVTLHAADGEDALYGATGNDTLIAAPAHSVLVASEPEVIPNEKLLDGAFVPVSTGVNIPGGTIENDATVAAVMGDGFSYTFNATQDGAYLGVSTTSLYAFNAPVGFTVIGPDGYEWDDTHQYAGTGYDPLSESDFGASLQLGHAGSYTLFLSSAEVTINTGGHFIGTPLDDTGTPLTLVLDLDHPILATQTTTVGTALHGGAGDDMLVGGSGSDMFDGGAGKDTASFAAAGQGVTADLNAGTVSGGVGDDSFVSIENLTGSDYNDTLTGDGGDNVLKGGAGADALAGGIGDDTYYVDNAGDAVTEAANAGNDTVRSTINYALTANVETLILDGTGRIDGVGNALDNSLIGNGQVNGLDGRAGADTMAGGLGDDTYWVDNAGDKVIEAANAGTDTVRSTINYVLGDNVENLILGGSAGLDGIGNALNNVMTGNSGSNGLKGGLGADTMAGGLGNDTYYVDNSGDKVIEAASAGTDTVHASVNYVLTDNVETLILDGSAGLDGIGNALNNVMTGNSGSNGLKGGLGADTMAGGLGNDTYYVDNSGDKVIEAANAGTDTVHASVNYVLTDNVENLILDGSAGLDGIGNALANVMTGNSGANRLKGGLGADTLTGGAGADRFYYSAASDSSAAAPDLITDFQHGSDKIDLTGLHLVSNSQIGITSSGGVTAIAIDSDKNGQVDMRINLTGSNVATMGDLVTGIGSAGADAASAPFHPDPLSMHHAAAAHHGLYDLV